MTMIFAIPSKGRLKEQAEAFLSACGLILRVEGRGYAASISGLDAEVRLVSSSEIVAGLREGKLHAGFAGHDLIAEAEPEMTRVALLQPLGFGFADLVVAAPQSWLDVDSMADFDEVCHAFRVRNGARLRVATKYPALTRDFFDRHGLDDYTVVASHGATEGAPAAGTAESIVDITTTGSTLAANHLKIIDDGIILRSQAWLAASRAARWSEADLSALAQLDAAIKAKGERVFSATSGSAGAFASQSRSEMDAKRAGESADFSGVENGAIGVKIAAVRGVDERLSGTGSAVSTRGSDDAYARFRDSLTKEY
jgi:ATP phosphoribosyltransferase